MLYLVNISIQWVSGNYSKNHIVEADNEKEAYKKVCQYYEQQIIPGHYEKDFIDSYRIFLNYINPIIK